MKNYNLFQNGVIVIEERVQQCVVYYYERLVTTISKDYHQHLVHIPLLLKHFLKEHKQIPTFMLKFATRIKVTRSKRHR